MVLWKKLDGVYYLEWHFNSRTCTVFACMFCSALKAEKNYVSRVFSEPMRPTCECLIGLLNTQ